MNAWSSAFVLSEFLEGLWFGTGQIFIFPYIVFVLNVVLIC